MSKISLVVEYEANEGRFEEFKKLITWHAERCLAEEPGTVRFELTNPIGDDGKPIPNRFMANEMFASMDALRVHRSTERFANVSEQFKTLLKNRRPMLSETIE